MFENDRRRKWRVVIVLLDIGGREMPAVSVAAFADALWSGTNKNRDVSTGPLARPFAHFAHSLARGKVNGSMSQNNLVLCHSAMAARRPGDCAAACLRSTRERRLNAGVDRNKRRDAASAPGGT